MKGIARCKLTIISESAVCKKFLGIYKIAAKIVRCFREFRHSFVFGRPSDGVFKVFFTEAENWTADKT